ncbi:hypothetical protein ABC195_15270 [Microbacterium sp. 2P01SA-2]
MNGINPDEIPLWFAIPAGLVLWGTWIAICVAEARERLRRMSQQ